MVDEAHRTQEGRLGADMREALPNAKFIGLTGTPISTDDRNTWETFGDRDDPDGVLNHYSVERSIADGATLPIHVETRLVDFHIDKAALDEAFAELAEAEAPRRGRAGLPLAPGQPGRHADEDPGAHRGGLRGHRRALPRQGRAARAEGAGRRLRPRAVRPLPRGDHARCWGPARRPRW